MLNVEAEANQLKGAYRYLVTKADLHTLENRLMLRLGGLIIAGLSVVVAVLRFWQ